MKQRRAVTCASCSNKCFSVASRSGVGVRINFTAAGQAKSLWRACQTHATLPKFFYKVIATKFADLLLAAFNSCHRLMCHTVNKATDAARKALRSIEITIRCMFIKSALRWLDSPEGRLVHRTITVQQPGGA